MTTEELLKPMFEVVTTYPGSTYKVGDILYCAEEEHGSVNLYKAHPSIFKRLPWYKNKTIEQMRFIEYVIITNTQGYYVNGDVVKVDEYIVSKNKNGFKIGTHFYFVNDVSPATKEQYDNRAK